MIKKMYTLLMALSVFTYTVNAANDPNAKKVLDQVSAKMKALKGITANFTYISKARTGKTNSTVNGKIIY